MQEAPLRFWYSEFASGGLVSQYRWYSTSFFFLSLKHFSEKWSKVMENSQCHLILTEKSIPRFTDNHSFGKNVTLRPVSSYGCSVFLRFRLSVRRALPHSVFGALKQATWGWVLSFGSQSGLTDDEFLTFGRKKTVTLQAWTPRNW
jgi:hypothetical protein